MAIGIDTNGHNTGRPLVHRYRAVNRSPKASCAATALSDEPAPYRERAESHEKPLIGYAAAEGEHDEPFADELEDQAEQIMRECEARGLPLLDVVREDSPCVNGAVDRPQLASALQQISRGEAGGLVVAHLFTLTTSVPELGRVLALLARADARLISATEGLDTAETGGRLAVSMLIQVAGWADQRPRRRARRVGEHIRWNDPRTVGEPHELRERIAQMLTDGMTPQLIADKLNAEGVPTVRGAANWHPSNVLATAGD